jgi:CubicO group peptidase (beta-lactamase class C family)
VTNALADTTARRLLARLGERQVAGRLPSIVAGVVRDGELVWSGGYGDVPAGGPADVQYRIGSITKTFTAVLVLQLVREGRIDLDAPAADVLGDVGYADRTLRQLLAHGSGMQSEPHGPWWERSAGATWDELAARHDGSDAVFPAGQQFHYSNLGYALLGEVVARTLGTSWRDALRERVLGPLGLTRTSYLPQGAAAQGWSVDPYAGTLTPEPATDTGAMAPAGQLWSTIADLARYASFLGAGHPDVLDLSWLDLATHPQAGDRHTALETAHGLGFQLLRGGSGVLAGHTGSMPGFLAACFVDRPRRTSAVLLTNATTGLMPGALARDLLEEVERCEPTLPVTWLPTTEVPEIVAGALGVWHWGNTPYVARLDGGDLLISCDGLVVHRFEVRGDRLVGRAGYHAGETLRVVRRDDGSVSHLECATFVYTRTPYDPDAPIPGGHTGRT